MESFTRLLGFADFPWWIDHRLIDSSKSSKVSFNPSRVHLALLHPALNGSIHTSPVSSRSSRARHALLAPPLVPVESCNC
jgi:hypothetical protein